MGRFSFGVTAGLLATAAGAAALALRISRETGKSFSEALSEVPAEAERYFEEAVSRCREAIEAGRSAAAEKQAEIEKRLSDRS